MPRVVGTARRIVLGFVLIYTLAALCLGLGVYAIGDRALREELDERIETEVAILSEIRARQGQAALVQAIRRRDARGVNNLGYLLVDPRGRHVTGELETPPPAPGWETISYQDLGDSKDARALTVTLPGGDRLSVAMEMEPAEELRRTTIRFFSLGLCVLLGGGIIGGLLLSRAIRGRLDAMNETAHAIIAGDMSQRVPEGLRDDEFRRLAVTLNRMLDRNSALIENVRQVSNDIAHDLRTPISRLRQRLERALALAPEEGGLHEEISGALEQSDAALSLFAALLRIAEVESGTLRQYFRPMDLSAVVRALCESYALAAEDSGRTLVCTIGDGIAVLGDEELVAQAVINILENALRHTHVGARITLRLERSEEPGWASLTVDDDGPGVADALLPRLTHRFVRSDKSRTTAGFGLGLNLVAAVVAMHGGEIRLSNRHPGLRAEMLLPALDHA